MATDDSEVAGMNLVMFAPCPKASAIGRMTQMVVKELGGYGHSVSVVCTESAENKRGARRDFGTQSMHWTAADAVQAAIASADAVIYQIGDNFQYHEGSLYWLERQRGIVCLHDFFLGNLFCGWAQRERTQASIVLQQWYGDEIARGYFGHASSANFIAATHEYAPLTEWVASQASAVIAHSGWGMGRVLSACPGPVRLVPLAYELAPGVCSPAEMPSRSTERMQVLTVGHVNPNKRAECVIRALGADQRLRESTSYTLAGAIQPDMRRGLEELANTFGVDLHICGEVSDQELRQLLSCADVVCCLRNPTLESASASAIEAMLSARPVIVENAGFYAELPDDCVRKIRPDHEEADLRKELLDLETDPTTRRSLGKRAQTWARDTFTAKNYARQLTDLVSLSQRSMLVSETMEVFARQLSQWAEAESMLALPGTLHPLRIFDVGSVKDEQG